TGIDLYVEARGFVPTREWKRTRFGERWYDGETVVASIGQGYILVTPLELAVAYAAIASGGKVPAPHLVKREVGSEDEPALSLTVGSRSLSLIRQALEGVVKDLHGTGRRADVPGVQAAGKTGTAQVVSLPEEDIPEEEIDYYRRDHAWFVGYAPSRDPEIVVAVVVEHGGSGGKVAAPIFREIVREYFRGRKQ
ncbi:MAG: penicillin-binding protein 2, partial [Deltaproteobacteria bacterium]